MKAAYINSFGGPEQIRYGDMPKPVPAADEILVIKDGQIVEHGQHEELIETSSVYKELYETQFKVPEKKEKKPAE